MIYQPEHMYWTCPDRQCAQVAFQREDIEEGKPILGRGILELVMIDDPSGSKLGRFILRTIDNNVMIDVTDYLAVVPVEPKTKAGAWEVLLMVHDTADNRTER
jgi:hypothetical protein